MAHSRSNPIDITVTANLASGTRTVKLTPSPRTSPLAASLQSGVNENITSEQQPVVSDVLIPILDDEDNKNAIRESASPLQERFENKVSTRPLSEDTPLIPHPNDEPQQKQDWVSWAASKTYHIAASTGTWAKESATHVVTHPVSSLLGLATSGQSAINAFVNPSNANPKDISWKWLIHMSKSKRAESFINLISSLVVNYPANKKFIEEAWGKLKNDTKDIFQSPGHFFNNFFSLFLGSASGTATGILTVGAFLWIAWGGLAIPSLLGVLGLLITSASRYIGLKRAIRVIENLFSYDVGIQKQAIDELKHLKQEGQFVTEEELQELGIQNSELADAAHPIMEILQALTDAKAESLLLNKDNLDDQDYEELFKNLVLALEKLEALHPDLYNKKDISEYISEYAGVLVRICFALACGLSAGGVFLQKGWDAVSFISEKASGNNLDDFNVWIKRLIGLPAGIGNGTLYAISASEFPRLFFIDLPTYLYNHPEHFISVFLLISVNYLASSSMESVASGVLNRPNNILGVLSEGQIKEILPYIVRAGGGFVNMLSELKKYKEDVVEPNHPTVKELIQHLRDPNIHRVNHTTAVEMAVALNKSSFFAKSPESPSAEADDLTHSRRDYEYAQI